MACLEYGLNFRIRNQGEGDGCLGGETDGEIMEWNWGGRAISGAPYDLRSNFQVVFQNHKTTYFQ